MSCLIVGLGNPGKQYEKTRHNLGFVVIDELVKRYAAITSNTKLKTKLWSTKHGRATVLFAQPQTFMNLSGAAVGPLVRSKKIDLNRLIVINDDLDLPLRKIRVSKDASAAGHNGVQSVIDALGTKNFTRVRIGIGRPTNSQPIEDYVLAKFSAEEKLQLPLVIDQAILEIEKIFQPSPRS